VFLVLALSLLLFGAEILPGLSVLGVLNKNWGAVTGILHGFYYFLP